ncbi:MAG: 2OG-Fe(II) oxygenase [Pseudomonadota bacterium]
MTQRTQGGQAVTPALMEWIAAQKAAGFSLPAVLDAMRVAGWSDDTARLALGLQAQVQETAAREPQGLPAEVRVPWPVGAGELTVLQAGDRPVRTPVVMQSPPLIVFESLLSDEECAALIEAARPRLSRSLTVAVKTGGEEENIDRTSQGMFFSRGESSVIQTVEERIARLLGWPIENGEGLQVLRYGPGAEYKPHYDYFDPAEPGTPTILQRGGQRVATLVIYLNEPESGGCTVFPDAQVHVMPRRGNAVFFNYSRPHPASRTLHGGSPVILGEKWIATKWLREGAFV